MGPGANFIERQMILVKDNVVFGTLSSFMYVHVHSQCQKRIIESAKWSLNDVKG